MPYAPIQQDTGSYVPQTPSFDISQLYEVEVGSKEFKELLVRLYQQVNSISIVLNNKISGYYLQEEQVNSGVYFQLTGTNPEHLRSVYRKIVYLTNLPAGITTQAHGITIDAQTSFTAIYGVANNTATRNYYPLPYASAGGALNIELRVTNTDVVITNNSGVTFDRVYVVLEYIKS